MRTIGEMRKAVVVQEGSGRKLGRIKHAVFHPSEPRLVGFVVHRGDTLGMIKHPDRFLAYDSFAVRDGRIVARKGSDGWDTRACARLGVDYEACTIWRGMTLATADGEELGSIVEVAYDERTGRVESVTTTDGPLSQLLVGASAHPAGALRGYRDGHVEVEPGAPAVLEGGVAEAAGTAFGKAAAAARETAPKVAAAADDAVQKGAYKLGEALGKSKGMFAEFKKEYEKGRRGDA